jgi:hypothetical protein
MFVVLQSGGYFTYDLNDAIVQIIDHYTCSVAHFWTITDRMVCTVSPNGWAGPCYVRGL